MQIHRDFVYLIFEVLLMGIRTVSPDVLGRNLFFDSNQQFGGPSIKMHSLKMHLSLICRRIKKASSSETLYDHVCSD
jgi:hypothetical protein